jgi:hypothetical protein
MKSSGRYDVWAWNLNQELGTFDPSLVGLGVHFVTCTFSNTACSATVSFMIRVVGANFTGHIFKDLDNDCVYDAGEEISNNLVYVNPGQYYFMTDSMGLYKGYLEEGAYTVHAVAPESYSFSCPETGFLNFTIANTNDTISDLDIGLNQEFECANLIVDVVIGGIIPCFQSHIYIAYCNYGSIEAEDTYIEVELSPVMTYTSGTIDYSSFIGNTYRYDIGSIKRHLRVKFYYYCRCRL